MNKAGLSIHAAPYRVELVSGKTIYAGSLKDVYSYRQQDVKSVFDRKANAFLDLPTLWTSHRRKFLA